MKKKIFEELENVAKYGFESFYSDFESEAELNEFLTWAAAFNDHHTLISPAGGKSCGMKI